MVLTRASNMAKDKSASRGGATPPAPRLTKNEQTCEITTPSAPTTLSDVQAPKPSHRSHEDHPGVPNDLITDTLSSHFNFVWRSHYEPKEDDYDSDAENNMPLKYDGFESAFDIGDFVRVHSDTPSAWAESMPGLDGYYSKQAFKITAKRLKAGPWWWANLGRHETETRELYFGDNEETFMEANKMDSHTLSLLYANEPESKSEDESETETGEEDSWENDYWVYRLEPVDPLQGFPVADVMLWKEENLVLDTDAKDVYDDEDDNDDNDDDHCDNREPHTERADKAVSTIKADASGEIRGNEPLNNGMECCGVPWAAGMR
ncbi:hypothetical protein LTR99_005403 [Exophiala xenobiotica]|uniref:Uncharacterized protein n=1 Tax=Vermiconidia calcicola TaxID=1690605 RepID=A0AAV9Q5N1_9PEZI|nr:hypothetical protein LTR41_007616 [Exophiala xenobiotica]KAK5303641.1 hypothetical protein LTR99_005403 [Exophiala xenobiotica]KAK5436743.1 hypothetical protein LTR34_002374 [Exophiala xenobiotica]KAK5535836.1 hypothetical protein LTR25_005738 [Vermiconidia calcicola]KAK5548776.1 hypothetical protein LTR23_001265 [Chaetothyriales sp. CCFEE 6169]